MESNNKSHTPRGSILKVGAGGSAFDMHDHNHHSDHVKFDEFTIAEHDKDRGTRQKISEPKTPYEAQLALDQENNTIGQQNDQEDVEMQSHDIQHIEEEVKQHLLEAERNKLLNAQLQAQEAGGLGS